MSYTVTEMAFKTPIFTSMLQDDYLGYINDPWYMVSNNA